MWGTVKTTVRRERVSKLEVQLMLALKDNKSSLWYENSKKSFCVLIILSLIVLKHINSQFCQYLIGGTLGLFTGMSFLSMIEILFWAFHIFSSTKKCTKEVADNGENQKNPKK